jgi:hypothetical protein
MTLSPSKSPSRCRSARGRRGALLLLVLGMLTLFLMIGTLMLVLALRARSTARAFADAVAGSGNRAAAARGLLDEALMRLLRGAPPPPADGAPAPQPRESLLADRYGPNNLSGKLNGLAVSGPVLKATVTGITVTTPLDLAGRILTIRPQASDPASVTSFRILATSGNTFDLANLRTVGLRPLPTMFPCDVYVNDREFAGLTANESWDSFDPDNLFLTQAAPQGSAGATIGRPAYGAAAGGACEVDNDGDGIGDGVWLNDVLPKQADGSTARISYLVLDLGGRLNVNTHGSIAGPAGSGPAAVDGTQLFSDPTVWSRLLAGGLSPALPAPLKQGARRGPPALGGNLQGRFGAGPSDTYGLRLDFDGPRPLSRTSTIGNVFTCGELEWVLRIYDDDTHTLPPRLAALLNDSGEAARMLVTTDSWDTCGMVGEAARTLASATKNVDRLPTETREGLRLNVDRLLQDDPNGDGDDIIRQKFFEDLIATCLAVGAPDDTKTQQWAANVVDFVDTDSDAGQYKMTDGAVLTGVEPQAVGTLGSWDKGRLESVGELLGIPSLNKAQLEEAMTENRPVISLAVEESKILDALTIASPFRTTVFTSAGGRTFCRWREPGRINVNTCDDRVWNSLTGATFANPFAGGAPPARSTADLLLKVPQVFTGPDRDVRKLDRRLANRLANIATTRSEVFAVWITLELTTPDADDEPSYHRLFAIVDRSIPVGYALGQNLNVRDTVRVSRQLE